MKLVSGTPLIDADETPEVSVLLSVAIDPLPAADTLGPHAKQIHIQRLHFDFLRGHS